MFLPHRLRALRRIRPVLDLETVRTIGTSFVHSKLDYCSSVYYAHPKHQLNRLQHIDNSVARAVVAAPRSSNPDHILRSLNWLKVLERIGYQLISITYKLLQSRIPHYLRNVIAIQLSRSTRSSSLVTLLYTPVQPGLKITNRSFRYAAPHPWDKLPASLRAPCQFVKAVTSPDSGYGPVLHMSHGVLHSRLKTHLFSNSFPV